MVELSDKVLRNNDIKRIIICMALDLDFHGMDIFIYINDHQNFRIYVNIFLVDVFDEVLLMNAVVDDYRLINDVPGWLATVVKGVFIYT